LDKVKTLPDAIDMSVIYVKEEKPPKEKGPIEWFLMTGEKVNTPEEAYELRGIICGGGR
jgi:hypothetical protein